MVTNFNYNKRNFFELRDEIKSFIKTNYPEVFVNFEDNAVGSVYIDILAGTGEMLYFNLDRVFQETQLENAQLKKSLFGIAKNLGVKLPNKKPSVTLIDMEVIIPAEGPTYSRQYLPIIKAGTQFTNGSVVFELLDDVDFSSPISLQGTPNLTIIPNLNNFNEIVNYKLRKTEIVYNGTTTISRRSIGENETKPFYQIILNDPNVIDITSVIVKNGNVSDATDEDFNDPSLKYYEVDYLAEQEVFIETTPVFTDNGIRKGNWTKVRKKFIKEFNENGYCRLTFGGGNGDLNLFTNTLQNLENYSRIESYLANTALGEKLPPNSTMFIKYRVGGGFNTNIAANTLTTVANKNMVVNGINKQINQLVINSLTVNNPIPALGGRDEYSIEEIRNAISYNYGSQGRAVTLDDYHAILTRMDGKYGVPFKYRTALVDNKIFYSILGLDSQNKLNNTSTDLLKQNLAEYVSRYRMINDYIEIQDGKIYNLAYNIEVLVEKNVNTDFEIITKTIKEVFNFHSVYKRNMGDDIYIGQLIEAINNVPKVINVVKIKAYNKINTIYSTNKMVGPFLDENTLELDLTDGTLYNTFDGMFEIKYPEDVKITVKKLGN